MEKNVIMHTDLLCKSFISDGEVNNVIKNMDLNIYKEDFTVIMGSSGSGKSTLLYLLSGMMEETSGEVYLKDKKLTGLKEKQMAEIRQQQIGFVFQAINLIPDLTIYENIISPTYRNGMTKEEVEQRATFLMEQMDILSEKKKYPSQLSGGQRQRVAICRGLMNEPEVLFADEPTGALNSTQGEHVLDQFTKIHENGQAVVMVTHDMKAAIRGSRILYLKDGRVDGDLCLNEYAKEDKEEREKCVYQFLRERGW